MTNLNPRVRTQELMDNLDKVWRNVEFNNEPDNAIDLAFMECFAMELGEEHKSDGKPNDPPFKNSNLRHAFSEGWLGWDRNGLAV